jgi:hypothetical protein
MPSQRQYSGVVSLAAAAVCCAPTQRIHWAPRSRCGRRAGDYRRRSPIRRGPAPVPSPRQRERHRRQRSTDTEQRVGWRKVEHRHLERNTYIDRRLRSVSARSAETSARNDDGPSRQIRSVASIRPLGELCWRTAARRRTGRPGHSTCPCRNAWASGPENARSPKGRSAQNDAAARSWAGDSRGLWLELEGMVAEWGRAARGASPQGYRSRVASGAETVLE